MTFNTDWIFVIVQLHWPKRLSHRHYTKNVGLIYKSIWYKIRSGYVIIELLRGIVLLIVIEEVSQYLSIGFYRLR